MAVRLAVLGMLALGAALAAPSAPARAADMFTSVQDTSLPQDQCVNRAADRLRQQGFQVNVSRTSAFAFRNQDGASVRCIPEKGIVVFFIYTTTGEQEGRALLEQLHAVYRAPQAPSAPSGGGKF